jgi:hypothetical protein
MPVDYYNVTLNPINGIQGNTGATGEQGSIGPRGHTGYTGYTGPIGVMGPTGEQGPEGVQGEKGHTGETGYTGAVGEKGDTGSTGSTGHTGPQGQTGPMGMSGDLFTSYTLSNWMSDPVTPGGTETLTIEKGLSFTAGNSIIVVSSSDTTHYFQGTVLSYSKTTGAIEIHVIIVNGDPNFTSDDYIVNLNPMDGNQGATGPAGETGPAGPIGQTGPTGKSGDIYYTSTPAQWAWSVSIGARLTLLVEPNLSYLTGNSVLISSPSYPTYTMQATVWLYAPGTGNMQVDVVSYTGGDSFPTDYYNVNLNPLNGPPGQGVPIGGATGYVLTKNSAINYDTAWKRGDAFFDMTSLAPYFVGGSPADLQTAIVRMAVLLSNMNSGPIP